MEQQLEQIRDQQKDSWNKFSVGWKKWDQLTMEFLKPMGEEIIAMLKLKDEDVVLDVAAGTGEPGLTIASQLTKGKVIIQDLSEEMLSIARDNARVRGINNIETRAGDVCDLPFDDNSFDAVSCRFGFMFFPDMQLAANEMYRVLKPGGRMAVSVWNVAEKNFWITAIMGTINRNMELPPPPPNAPGMFRCAKEGLMQDIMKQAGFKNTAEKEVVSKLNPGTTERYWSMMNEIGPAIVAALKKADQPMKDKIKSESFKAVNDKFPDGNIVFDSSALIIYGEK